MYVVAVGIGGDARGVEAMGIEQIHARVLGGHLLGEHILAKQLRVALQRGFPAFVAVGVNAVAAAVAGGLDEHPAVLFHKGGEFLRRDGGGIEPFAAEELAKEHVEEYLVARRGAVARLIVADAVDETVPPPRGEERIANFPRSLIKLEVKILPHVAADGRVSRAVALPRRVDAGEGAEAVKFPLCRAQAFPFAVLLRADVRKLSGGARDIRHLHPLLVWNTHGRKAARSLERPGREGPAAKQKRPEDELQPLARAAQSFWRSASNS